MLGELVPVGGGDNIPLRKPELVIGRKEECDIVLRFSNISSRHCMLVLSSGYWYVKDLKSTNGVKVNGVKVDDRRIDPGARFMISKHEYTLEYDPQELGAAGALPPDVLDTDVFSKSLMERAGLQGRARTGRFAKSPSSSSSDVKRQQESQKPKSFDIERVDYSMFSIDDIHFE